MGKRNQDNRSLGYRFLEAVGDRPFPQGAIDCAQAGFMLYGAAWDCHSHHIKEWKWPFQEIRDGGQFEGDEPWVVLLRHAVTMVRRQKQPAGQLTALTSPNGTKRPG